MNYWRCKYSIRCPRGKNKALGEGLKSCSRTGKHRGPEGTISGVMPILQKQNFKISIHPKFKMSWWKLPRILLNTKVTIIPYFRFIIYSRKLKNQAKSIKRNNLRQKERKQADQTLFLPVLPVLINDSSILPVQPSPLSLLYSWTSFPGFLFSGLWLHDRQLAHGMSDVIQHLPLPPVRPQIHFPFQLDIIEKVIQETWEATYGLWWF